MKKTSQRSLLFRQNVNRTEAEGRAGEGAAAEPDDISGNEERYRNGIVTSKGILVRRPKWNFEAKPVVEAA